jgi:hypothetical protein
MTREKLWKFTAEESRNILLQYQAGASSGKIADKLGASRKAVSNAIRRSGGLLRMPRTPYKFTAEQSAELRREYENFVRKDGRPISLLQISKRLGVAGQVVLAAIVRAGGKAKKRGETARKHSSERFQRIFKRYGWMEQKYWSIWENQNGRCFWCNRSLPRNSSCVVDHCKNKTRGLCCPDNQCNMVAGQLETTWKFAVRKIQTILRRKNAK